MIVEYDMDHPSGTYRFYNPNNDGIVMRDSVKWSEFKQWDIIETDSVIVNI